MYNNDTIFALATPFGKSGVAVIRVSGADAMDAIKGLGVSKNIKPRITTLCDIYSYPNKELLDNVLIIYHQAPHSFTGEDVIEIQCHGSIAVLKDIMQSLGNIKNLRQATAGEFSKRAFYNNKLDLTKAEGLVSLINAETSVQRRIALQQAIGQQESMYESWRQQMVELLAYIEALIDFPDEDIPSSLQETIHSKINIIIENINNHLQVSARGETLMNGVRIAIVGAPNAGKSSLMNYLNNEEVAIVNEKAGTTRDIIQTKIDLKGYQVIFYDTAGIRNTTHDIEREGVKRALQKAKEADILIYMIDASQKRQDENLQFEQQLSEISISNIIKVYNKVDISSVDADDGLKISAKTGEGISELMERLLDNIANNFSLKEGEIIANQRQRQLLIEAVMHLQNINKQSLDIIAENIRLAANALGYITGKIDIEEILDQVFSSFCIGK